MKLRIVFAIAGIVWLNLNQVHAQSYAEEALMVSRIHPGGSARIQGMGGVQNSLGGDVSSAYYNPAGLGMFNRSDFSFTPGYVMANTSSSYLGNTTSSDKNTLIIPNFGLALHSGKDGSKGLWGGTFAINYNRTNDFNSTVSYSGTNNDNSIIDYFIQNANGTGTSQFADGAYNYNTPTGLAYFNYLIGPQSILNPPGPDNQYFTDVSGIPLQSELIKTTGSQSQWSFSYGVNFNDKIFVGGGLGLAALKYKAEKTYIEKFEDTNQPMSNMQLNETLDLNGNGINATIGAIIRPMDQFQFGVSIMTPTGYTITDNYSASMTTSWRNFEYEPNKFLNNEKANTDILTSSYTISTPWRFSGGLTFFIQKKGFLSADVEYLSYGSTKFKSGSGDDFSVDNSEIKSLYKSVLNLRFGGEYRLNTIRLRAGYSLMPDPFQTPQNGIDRSLTSLSAGVGYRVPNFYVDFAAVYQQGKNSYQPYTLSNGSSNLSPLVKQDNKATMFMITFGFPF